MNTRFRVAFIVVIFLLGVSASAHAGALEILGARPEHVQVNPSSAPNDQAITKRIWAPGIDDGYVPQGVTWANGILYVSSYQSTDPSIGKGPCRVYKVDPDSGKTLGLFDLPKDCGHAGGLVYTGHDSLVVSDTRRLYKIDVKSAFGGQSASTAIVATVKLSGQVKGSFVGYDGASLFVGTYARNVLESLGHVLPLSIFDTHNGGMVDETNAVRTIPIPLEAQGAAFDKADNLWISASSSRSGNLYKVDSKTGDLESKYDMIIGIEGLAFDDKGRLWSVSEAGSIRWQTWTESYPLLFLIDPSKLH